MKSGKSDTGTNLKINLQAMPDYVSSRLAPNRTQKPTHSRSTLASVQSYKNVKTLISTMSSSDQEANAEVNRLATDEQQAEEKITGELFDSMANMNKLYKQIHFFQR